LTVFGSGAQTRSWGYVDDIIEGLSRLFWRDNVTYAGPVNIGNDREVSVIDVAKFVAGLIPGTTIEFAPPAVQDPSNRRPDLAIANRLIPGWKCSTAYEEGVKRTLDWFSQRADALAARKSVA
jgi:UDP-glucose 4-epimerase/UDP-glucuronate decarboxylase